MINATSNRVFDDANDEADRIMAEALELRSKLRGSGYLPLPDKETEALIAALAEFVRAAEAFDRR